MEYSILAAREATARLGHDDACAHYLRALHVMDEHRHRHRSGPQHELLLELAAAHERAGRAALRCSGFARWHCSGVTPRDAEMLARGALGMQSLGDRAGSGNAELVELLQLAGQRLADTNRSHWHCSRSVHAALARCAAHGAASAADPRVIPAAHRAVELAVASGDARALALARLALQDSMWTPGSAAARLPVIVAMLEAATSLRRSRPRRRGAPPCVRPP